MNSEGNVVETVAQVIAELNRLRTQRSDDTLLKLGQTPTFSEYPDAYIVGIKADAGTKKPNTITKEEQALALWKSHLGGIRLDKIRPSHVAGFMKKRLADDMGKRTIKLDIIALRNVLKQARDVDQHIPGHGAQPAGVEFRFELLGGQAVRAGELDVLETEVAHLVERPRHVLGKLVAQAVELQPDGMGEARSGFSLGGSRREDKRQRNDAAEHGQKNSFHGQGWTVN